MPLQQFTWRPDKEATGTSQFAVNTVQFGDGYSQSAEDGLNNETASWPLTFTKKRAEAEAIKAFLKQHKGAKAFAWQPPLEPMQLFTAGEYTVTPLTSSMYRITVTFEQVYRP